MILYLHKGDSLKEITICTKDESLLYGYTWDVKKPKAIIVIIHGMAEYSARYDRFAKILKENNYAAISIDLRGHGKTAKGNIKGFFAKKDGWHIILDDIKLLINKAKMSYPNIPVVLFGHSMGSIFARAAMIDYGKDFDACILMGVTVNKKGLRDIAPMLSKFLSLFGNKKPSNVLDFLTFGAYNNPFKPNRTKFDWISRDEVEVDKYISDDLCGFYQVFYN